MVAAAAPSPPPPPCGVAAAAPPCGVEVDSGPPSPPLLGVGAAAAAAAGTDALLASLACGGANGVMPSPPVGDWRYDTTLPDGTTSCGTGALSLGTTTALGVRHRRTKAYASGHAASSTR